MDVLGAIFVSFGIAFAIGRALYGHESSLRTNNQYNIFFDTDLGYVISASLAALGFLIIMLF